MTIIFGLFSLVFMCLSIIVLASFAVQSYERKIALWEVTQTKKDNDDPYDKLFKIYE